MAAETIAYYILWSNAPNAQCNMCVMVSMAQDTVYNKVIGIPLRSDKKIQI